MTKRDLIKLIKPNNLFYLCPGNKSNKIKIYRDSTVKFKNNVL